MVTSVTVWASHSDFSRDVACAIPVLANNIESTVKNSRGDGFLSCEILLEFTHMLSIESKLVFPPCPFDNRPLLGYIRLVFVCCLFNPSFVLRRHKLG